MVTYSLCKEETAEYVLKMMRSGVCSALLPGSYYDSGNSFEVSCDDSNTITLEKYLLSSPQVVLGSFKRALKAVILVVESCNAAANYLIFPENISFDYKDVFVSDGKVRLLIKNGADSDLTKCIIELCNSIQNDYPKSNADAIAQKLIEESQNGKMNAKAMLKFLSRWLDELH